MAKGPRIFGRPLMLRLTDDDLRELDAAAEALRLTRSEVIRDLLDAGRAALRARVAAHAAESPPSPEPPTLPRAA